MIRRLTAAAARIVLVSILPLGGLAAGTALEPTPLMVNEAKVVVQLLESVHYLNTPAGDDTFRELLTEFMGALDNQRLFFLAGDQDEFTKTLLPRLGRDLRDKGSLDAAMHIYEVYRFRAEARVNWIMHQLDGDIDLSNEEAYPLERDKAPWPATLAEADEIWRQRLEFELLPDLLNGKSIDEARAIVRQRYERLGKNLAEIEAEEVQEIFLSALTQLYDPHSTFFSAETYEDFAIQMRLSLIGIGALLSSEDGYCTIKELVPGSPAALSKQLQPNDKIVAVAQVPDEPVDVIGMNLRKVVKMIRGAKGSTIRLTIIPADAGDLAVRKEVTLVREVVQLNASRARATIQDVPSPDGGTMPIGVIDVPSFYGPVGDGGSEDDAAAPSVTADVEHLLGSLRKEGVAGVVLDFRRNGGGLLDEAVSLTGLFIPTGPVVVVRDQSGSIGGKADQDPRVAYDGPLAVLTSRYSASAAEIVAGALQNYGRAIIVGDRSTHGKGTVQEIYPMSTFLPRRLAGSGPTGAAKLTIQKFYLPNGSSTQHRGVIPDISLPAIEDFLPIGEADLPHSLPWDEIRTASLRARPLDPALKEHLEQASASRIASLDEFALLVKRIAWLRSREEMKEVPLSLETRRAMKTEEETFRADMKTRQTELAAIGFPSRELALDSVAGLEPPAPVTAADTPDADAETVTPDFDVHLRETLRILRDAIALAPDPADWTQNAAVLAALSHHRDPVAPLEN